MTIAKARPTRSNRRTYNLFAFHPLAAAASLGLIALLPGCAGQVTAPDTPDPAAAVEAAAATITPDDVLTLARALAHDSMAGRDTPSPELEQAARYMADLFRSLGLEPAGEGGTYIDRFELDVRGLDEATVFLGAVDSEDPPRYAVDYYLYPPPRLVEAQAYYVGVAGQTGPPPQEARGKVLIYEHPSTEWDGEARRITTGAMQQAMMTGAPAVLFIQSPAWETEHMAAIADRTAAQRLPLGVASLVHEAGAGLIADLGWDLETLAARGEPTALGERPIRVRATRINKTITPPNVAALRRGSDPALRDTYVVLTAHFDHLGIGPPDETGDSIYNGADDNASGVSAVLEVAEAFATLDPAPARSVVFLLVSAEEIGLLGSQAWVADPTVDLDGVVANINMDMVGRNEPDTIVGIGQEYSTLEGVIATLVAAHPDIGLNVILDRHPEENYFFRSDQLPFIRAGIPAVFFTGPEHEDYHQQSDEVEKLSTIKIARVARLAFYLAHAIAENPERPEWTEAGRERLRQMLGGAAPF